MRKLTMATILVALISSSVMAKTPKPCQGIWIRCFISKVISCGKGPCKVPVFVPVVKKVK